MRNLKLRKVKKLIQGNMSSELSILFLSVILPVTEKLVIYSRNKIANIILKTIMEKPNKFYRYLSILMLVDWKDF